MRQSTRYDLGDDAQPGLAGLAGFPVELLPRKRGRPFKERPPDAERGRAGGIVDEVADKPFDARALEDEDHRFLAEEDAVPPKTGLVELVRRALARI